MVPHFPRFDPLEQFAKVYNAVRQAITKTGPSISQDQFDKVRQQLGEQLHDELEEAGRLSKVTKHAPVTAEAVGKVASSYLSDSELSDVESTSSEPGLQAVMEENAALRQENALLRAEIARLRQGQAAGALAGGEAPDTLQRVLEDRKVIVGKIKENQRKLEDAKKEYDRLMDLSQDPEAIESKKKELKTARSLVAKKALQDAVKDYEEKTISPLNETFKQLRLELTQTAVRMTNVTLPQPLKSEELTLLLKIYLEKPENKDAKHQIKEAINPKPGIKARDVIELLRPHLLKFLESQKPDWMSEEEWVTCETTAADKDSKAILRHQGIVINEILNFTEQLLSKDWKVEQRFRLPR